MVTLGKYVTDSVTGFKGVAVSRTTYLYGCIRVGVEAANKDGKPITEYFDEQRLDGSCVAPQGGPGDVPPVRNPE